MISAARCQVRFLPTLAGFRGEAAVRAFVQGEWCWIRWPEDRSDVLAALRPILGVEFYEFRAPHWYPAGKRLPSELRPPDGDGESLARLMFPGSFSIAAVEDSELPRLPLELVRGGSIQPATALECDFEALAAWAETATTAELRSIRAAVSGSRVLLLGTKPPTIPGAERFWGKDVFLPVGFRIVPELPLPILRRAIGANSDEYAFIRPNGIELVAMAAFDPLTRAGLHMAVRA